MRYIGYLFLFVGLYVLGRMLGPFVTDALVDDGPSYAKNLSREVELADSGFIYNINLSEEAPADFPTTVTMLVPAKLPLKDGDGRKAVKPGEVVNVRGLKQDKLIVESTDGLAKGNVPVADTSIFKDLAMKKHQAKTGGVIPTPPTPAKPVNPPVNPKKEEPKTPEKPKEDNGMVAKKDDSSKEATPEKPMEKPAEEPAAPQGDLSAEQIVEVMQASIKAGAVKEFTFEQVKDWEAKAEKETIDGTEFQIGIATYEGKTIFGLKDVKAKALIQNGKIDRWVYAKTGRPIP